MRKAGVIVLALAAAFTLGACDDGFEQELQDLREEKQYIDECHAGGGQIERSAYGYPHCVLPDSYDVNNKEASNS